MGLTMKEKKSLTREVASRYKKSTKGQKRLILDEFIQITGYTRCYASYLLRSWGKRIIARIGGLRGVILVGDRRMKTKRKRERVYDEAVFTALKRIWFICDCICGKRLAPLLKEIIPILERFGEIKLDKPTRAKLLSISAATIDRLLSPEKRKLTLKGKARTKPGTLLKHQIPIKTFADWDNAKPGFVEVDLVSHDGGNPSGDYIQTLNLTDVCTGWTETQAVKNKAQVWVFSALKDITERLPFPLLGLDSDNGSEFINAHLVRFCEENRITFTRSRVNKKNDSCYVEQKNYSVVRRSVGYYRYEGEYELVILNEMYGYLRLYINFFQPVAKLIKKEREGSKVKKVYDEPKSPYRRVLSSPYISDEIKEKLGGQYDTLNPAYLKREITRLQNKLVKLASLKYNLVSDTCKEREMFLYNLPEAMSNTNTLIHSINH